jgi:preprotein translocase subunit SecG
LNTAGEGGDNMQKITALLLSLFFALSVLGCATTRDKAGWDEPSRDTISQSQNPGMNPGP